MVKLILRIVFYDRVYLGKRDGNPRELHCVTRSFPTGRTSVLGDLILFGEREVALRILIDPEKLSAYGLAAADVVAALREQNVQVSSGSIGAPPNPGDNAFEYEIGRAHV